MDIQQTERGQDAQGQPIVEYSLSNDNGVVASVLNMGARWCALVAPDEAGHAERVLGTSEQPNDSSWGVPFVDMLLPDGIWALPLATQPWTAREHRADKEVSVVFSKAVSKDGQPLAYVHQHYSLNHENQLLLRCDVQCAQEAYVVAGLRPYFALAPTADIGIGEHILMVHAYKYMSPMGNAPALQQPQYVMGSPWNLSRGSLMQPLVQAAEGKALSVRYLINKEPEKWGAMAKCMHRGSGRVIEVVSNQPSLMVSSKPPYNTLCISPEPWPLMASAMPKTYVAAGDTYSFLTRYTFTTVGAGHKH